VSGTYFCHCTYQLPAAACELRNRFRFIETWPDGWIEVEVPAATHADNPCSHLPRSATMQRKHSPLLYQFVDQEMLFKSQRISRFLTFG
jgi:hypothetical protein